MTGSEWAWNWVDSTAKLAYRIDAGETGVFGYNATIHHNVAIRALNGFQIKGFSQCALAAFSSLIHPCAYVCSDLAACPAASQYDCQQSRPLLVWRERGGRWRGFIGKHYE